MMNTTSTSTSLASPKFSLPARVAELYPLRYDRQVDDTLRWLLTPDRDGQGRRILRALPSEDQRHLLAQRLGLLTEHLKPAKRGDIARAVNEMLVGYGSARAAGEEESAVVLTQYVKVLEGFPIWAIKRVCGRFARGEVSPDEVGGKLDKGHAPSTSQIVPVVAKVVEDFNTERAAILDTRRGVIEQKISPEERARVGEKIKKLSAELHASVDAEQEKLRSRGFKPFTDDELRAIYAKPEADAAPE